jgi:hypothetical protein
MAKSIYKTPEGEAEIRALYDDALAGLGPGHESLTVGTRLGDTHVIARHRGTTRPECADPPVAKGGRTRFLDRGRPRRPGT